jgi:Fe2+ transport system protein B
MEERVMTPEEMLERLRFRGNGFHLDEPLYSPSGQARIALVGLPGVGKRTLYNSIWGWDVVTDTMPRQPITQLGLFHLVDLPEDPQGALDQPFYPEEYDMIVYLLDAQHGLRPEDFQWIAQLRVHRKALMIVLNKANLLSAEHLKQGIEQLHKRLSLPVMPLDNTSQIDVHQKLLPAILESSPELGNDLGAEIISLRRRVARQMIRKAVISIGSLYADVEAAPDAQAVLDAQRHMLDQITEIYNDRLAGQVVMTTALHSLMQFLSQTTARLNKDTGWIVWRIAAASVTWVLGYAAIYQLDDSLVISWRKLTKVESPA